MLQLASPATLARYGRQFKERANRYPRSLHLRVVADDRCRSEFFTAERRRQERFADDRPGMTAFNKEKPWESVMREASTNVEFWLREWQEPALIYGRARGEEHPSWTHQQLDQQQQGHKRGRDGAPAAQGEVCRNYNLGRCTTVDCRRAHVCENCRKAGHTKAECWSKGGGSANQDKPKGKGKGGKNKKKKNGM